MKKFLSLVLALVMTMSLVTISAGAKDFTDADKVTYTEAVDVLSAVKVIDGYTDGAFKPTNQLNRGQAAKILCNMILGPTTASALKADAAPFKDVPADSTFAAYIAYCAKEGIIDGYTDGTFRPTAPLTGYAFMKLLLGALGYDKDIEGYNQPNWSINVAKRALAIGLDKGLVEDFDGTKIVTREEACLYALNTMKADMVEYDAKTSVSVGGAEVVIAGSKAKEVVNNAKVETIDEDDVLQFAEKYFTNLKLDDTARDDFARPSNLWKLKAEKIGTYPKTPDLSYTKKVESGDIYSDLGLGSTIVAKNVDVYVDGVAKANNVSLMKGGESTMGVAANGVLTEVYYDDKADTADIIQVNTYIGQVAKTVKATDAKDAYIVITPEAKRPASGSGMEFETDEVFEDDAYVLYTYSKQGKGAVKSAVVAETVEGTVTACENKVIDGEKSQNVTIDGETYKVAAQFTGEEIGNVTVKSDYKVYLDKYGYMIKIEEVENLSADYALVMALRGQNDFDSNRAKLLFGDGTVKVVDTAKDYTKASNKVSTWDIVSYKEENGVYTLKSVPATSQYTATEQVGGEFALINSKAGVVLTDDVAGAKTLSANSKTTFVVYDLKDDDIDAYTGVKTVPTIKTTATVNADVYAYCKNSTMTTIMFVLADSDAIIEDENNKSLYVANESASNLIHNSTGDYFEYNAVVGGEITTVKVDDDVANANDLKGIFKSYTTNSKGVITGLTSYTGASIFGDGSDKEYLAGTGISKTSADYTVTLDTVTGGKKATLTVDDDAKIYYVDEDGKISESSYSAIAVDDDDKVYAYVDEYLVKTLYIEQVEPSVDDIYNGTGTGANYSYSTMVYSTGYTVVNVTAERPEWVDKTCSNAMDYSFDIYVNDQPYGTVTTAGVDKIATGDTKATYSWTNAADYFVKPIAAGDKVEVKNFAFKYSDQQILMKLVDQNGDDIAWTEMAQPANQYTTTAGANTTFAFAAKYSTKTTKVISVENATTTTTLPTAEGNTVTLNALKADATGYVIVKLDTSKLVESFGITSETAALTGAGVAASTYGVSSTSAEKNNKLVIAAKSPYTLTGNDAGDSIMLTADFEAFAGTTYAMKVTVKIGSQTLTAVQTNPASAVDLGFVTLDKSYEIKDADVTVEVIDKLVATRIDHTVGSRDYTITFNRDIKSVNGSGLVVLDTDVTNNDDIDFVSYTISGKTLTVKLASELSTGKKITVVGSKFQDADYTGNVNAEKAFNLAISAGVESWT